MLYFSNSIWTEYEINVFLYEIDETTKFLKAPEGEPKIQLELYSTTHIDL